MKKLYTIVPIIALTLCTSFPVAAVGNGTKMSVERPARTHRRTADLMHAGRPAPSASRAPLKTPPEGTWKSLGEGTYCEDLLTYYNDIPSNMRWKVEVEESESTPGWYRFIPYGDGSGMASIMGSADNDTYIYINATDPYKVYVEDIFAYGQYEISNLTVTTGWPDNGEYEYYGWMSEGIITFEPGSFAIGVGTGWQQTSLYTGFKLSLPGYELPDYTFILDTPFCAEDNVFQIDVTKGADISEVYYLVVPSEHYVDLDGLEYDVLDNGTKLDDGIISFEYTPEAAGLYTVMAVGLDANGELIASDDEFIVAVDNDNDHWRPIGRAIMTEAYFSSVYEMDSEPLEVEIEENIETPGRYRLRNPYDNHSELGNYTVGCLSHDHYLYINASDPERVYVEASVPGLSYISGEVCLWSQAASCIDYGETTEAIELAGYYGKLTDGVIIMPDYTLLMSEKYFYESEFVQCGVGFAVKLPKSDGVNSITSEADEAGTEYFNIQGIRIDDPSAPGLYIRRDGNTVTKIIR